MTEATRDDDLLERNDVRWCECGVRWRNLLKTILVNSLLISYITSMWYWPSEKKQAQNINLLNWVFRNQ